MLLRGFIDALMMRSQQALAFHAAGYLPPEHYDQIFSAHGTIMIFFVAMPFVIGLMNFVVPLQLGVRDVAFPDPELREFLAHGSGRAAGQRSRWSSASSPAPAGCPIRRCPSSPTRPGVGVDYYLWAIADLRDRHAHDGHQHGHDDPQDARPRHELHAHADLLLDRRSPRVC